MKFEAIRTDADDAIPITVKCAALGVSTQGYYIHCKRRALPCARTERDRVLTKAITEAHHVGRQTYGTPRLKLALHQQGHRVSRRTIARLRDAAGLCVRGRKKFTKTTQSEHDAPIAENILNRNFNPPTINHTWVSDITYLWAHDHFVYLCTIIDCFSNRVIGRKISDTLSTTLLTDAFDMAVASRKPNPGCVFHSDRGVQYTSHAFRARLSAHGFLQSMSRKGNCWDNAVSESSFARLKHELGDTFPSDACTVRDVYEYLDVFHNHIRIHSKLNMSPAQFERQALSQN